MENNKQQEIPNIYDSIGKCNFISYLPDKSPKAHVLISFASQSYNVAFAAQMKMIEDKHLIVETYIMDCKYRRQNRIFHSTRGYRE